MLDGIERSAGSTSDFSQGIGRFLDQYRESMRLKNNLTSALSDQQATSPSSGGSNSKPQNWDTLKRYCDPELRVRLEGALKNNEGGPVRVVNTGLVSSGKSSLYNALTGYTDAEHERFPTGAARTTISADTLHHGDIDYIDTPGIDVRDADDAVAFETIMASDLIIMIHNIKTGPLNRAETDWLSKISGGIPSVKARQRRLMFVCTWKDTREQEEGYPSLIADIKQAVRQKVGCDIPFFEVSVKKYLDGVNKSKPALQKSSGVLALMEHIQKASTEYVDVKVSDTQGQLNAVLTILRERLVTKREAKKLEISRMENDVASNYKSKQGTWNDTYRTFKTKRENLDRQKEKLATM